MRENVTFLCQNSLHLLSPLGAALIWFLDDLDDVDDLLDFLDDLLDTCIVDIYYW